MGYQQNITQGTLEVEIYQSLRSLCQKALELYCGLLPAAWTSCFHTANVLITSGKQYHPNNLLIDISTKPVQLCSPSSLLTKQANSTPPALLLQWSAYLASSFIVLLACTVKPYVKINQVHKSTNFCVSKMEFSLFDGSDTTVLVW